MFGISCKHYTNSTEKLLASLLWYNFTLCLSIFTYQPRLITSDEHVLNMHYNSASSSVPAIEKQTNEPLVV